MFITRLFLCVWCFVCMHACIPPASLVPVEGEEGMGLLNWNCRQLGATRGCWDSKGFLWRAARALTCSAVSLALYSYFSIPQHVLTSLSDHMIKETISRRRGRCSQASGLAQGDVTATVEVAAKPLFSVNNGLDSLGSFYPFP